ncbi:MAG TPA: hypothetical protein DD706_19080 [Nitrospiraceae bacterium]|nr:hypothetical protein [Nitrospiraceae bacterium]
MGGKTASLSRSIVTVINGHVLNGSWRNKKPESIRTTVQPLVSITEFQAKGLPDLRIGNARFHMRNHLRDVSNQLRHAL